MYPTYLYKWGLIKTNITEIKTDQGKQKKMTWVVAALHIRYNLRSQQKTVLFSLVPYEKDAKTTQKLALLHLQVQRVEFK